MNFTTSDSLSILSRYGINLSAADLNLNATKTVVVGLSGGVDSSVSALLLKLMNYRVIGIHMKNWHTCNPDDYADVVSVANLLDIPYYAINLADDYGSKVFDSFVKDLNLGLTPNPDILCNKYIKFDTFFKHALLLGADFVATGHYAKIFKDGDAWCLARPRDLTKDQTYFLYAVNPAVLNRVLFPLGDLNKMTVRQIARDFNLVTAAKKDSTGICFIDNKNFRSFISDYITATKGNFLDKDGNILGVHSGLPFYTIGQKTGLDLNYTKGSRLAKIYSDKKMVVAAKNLKDNSITLVVDGDPLLKTLSLTVRDKTTNFTGSCWVRWRNLGDLVPAVITNTQVLFSQPSEIVAPGQSIVAYNDLGKVVSGMIVV